MLPRKEDSLSMPPSDTATIAQLLNEIGQRMELKEEPNKARAYYRAVQSLLTLPESIDSIVEQGRLREIPGVGEAIEEKIQTLYQTGTHPFLERLRQEIPATVLEMLAVPGLSSQKVMALYRQLSIGSLTELEAACQSGLIASTKGFGPSLQKKILSGIEMLRERQGRLHIHTAEARVLAACVLLKQESLELDRIVPAGEIRRGCEVVEEPLIVVAQGLTTAYARRTLASGLIVAVTDAAHYGLALLFETGSPTHLEKLRVLAQERGLTLHRDRLARGNQEILCPEEADVYAALGMAWIAPELREGEDEIERALQNRLPALVTDADIRGILHCHTDFSDGVATLEEMTEATRRRGYQYFGVADHSRSAFYAGGLKEERVVEQQRMVDTLNQNYSASGFHIFKGIECDILQDGSLDYPDNVLETFDYVVASVHSRFSLDEVAQTARIVRAVSHPRTTILGHATGRLLLRRKGYAVDVEKVLQACAEYGVAVEINADPHRLDLDWRWHRRALELGCLLSINPDAHSTKGIENMRWGVKMARKGGVSADRVLNCLDRVGITGYFQARRKQS
jgi:DNA polymerase (family X)